jgi:hypothetical protein
VINLLVVNVLIALIDPAPHWPKAGPHIVDAAGGDMMPAMIA